jgi:hypothetical protein
MDDTEDRIRALAHQLWVEDGCPEGREDRHWFKASDIVRRQDFEATVVAPNAAMEAEDYAGVSNPDPAARQSDEPVEQRALEDLTAAKVAMQEAAPAEAAPAEAAPADAPKRGRPERAPARKARPPAGLAASQSPAASPLS